MVCVWSRVRSSSVEWWGGGGRGKSEGYVEVGLCEVDGKGELGERCSGRVELAQEAGGGGRGGG